MQLDAAFWTALLQIIGVNIVLSGDNAVVIAMACRSLPPQRQKWGILLGAGAAIVLRIVFTIFIVSLLTVPYLKIAGAVLLLWIGLKLMTDNDEGDDVTAATGLWHAVRIILVADAIMSLDNVIAVASVANGSYVLLILGLVISVPLVIYGAAILVKLLNRYPMIVPAGAALIGYVAGEVVITDPKLDDWVALHAPWLNWAAPVAGALLVALTGRIIDPRPLRRGAAAAAAVASSAALLGVRSSLQLFGRGVVARAPLLVSFVASALGYAASEEPAPAEPTLQIGIDILHALRPVFVAVIAIGLGELTAWLARRIRPTKPRLDRTRSGQ